jgi:hypothetical protein
VFTQLAQFKQISVPVVQVLLENLPLIFGRTNDCSTTPLPMITQLYETYVFFLMLYLWVQCFLPDRFASNPTFNVEEFAQMVVKRNVLTLARLESQEFAYEIAPLLCHFSNSPESLQKITMDLIVLITMRKKTIEWAQTTGDICSH